MAQRSILYCILKASGFNEVNGQSLLPCLPNRNQSRGHEERTKMSRSAMNVVVVAIPQPLLYLRRAIANHTRTMWVERYCKMAFADCLHDLARNLASNRYLTRIIGVELVKRKPSHSV